MGAGLPVRSPQRLLLALRFLLHAGPTTCSRTRRGPPAAKLGWARLRARSSSLGRRGASRRRRPLLLPLPSRPLPPRRPAIPSALKREGGGRHPVHPVQHNPIHKHVHMSERDRPRRTLENRLRRSRRRGAERGGVALADAEAQGASAPGRRGAGRGGCRAGAHAEDPVVHPIVAPAVPVRVGVAGEREHDARVRLPHVGFQGQAQLVSTLPPDEQTA